MNIKKISITNFMGISGTKEFPLPSISALIGENGIGKTTVLNAIRFAITGEKPPGELIHQVYIGENPEDNSPIYELCEEAKVSILLENGVEYEREERRDKANRCKINGKVTSVKSFNESLQDAIGVSLDALKIVSSADIISSLRPRDLSEFILKYIPEELDVNRIISYIPDITPGAKEILESLLPAFDKFGISSLNEAEELCRSKRKEVKSELSQKESVYATLPKEEPLRSKDVVEEELLQLVSGEDKYRVYKIKKEAYDNAKENAERQSKLYNNIIMQAEEITAQYKEPELRLEIVKGINNTSASLNSCRTTFATLKNSYVSLEKNLNELNQPICPLSKKLVCNTDKSSIRSELEHSLQELKNSLILQKEEMERLKSVLASSTKQLEDFDAEHQRYEKKTALLKQAEEIKNNIIEVPTEPEVVESYSAERKNILNKELLSITKWEEGQNIKQQIELLKVTYSNYDSLVKALEPKGPVRNSIMEYYLNFFSEACNKKAGKLKTGLSYTFKNEDGIKIYCNTGKGTMLPYESLSGGERAYMIFIIMDMLSQLTGAKILLLDELSVMDKNAFKMLLKLLNEHKADYDHTIIATVNHEDSIQAIKDEGIPVLGI